MKILYLHGLGSTGKKSKVYESLCTLYDFKEDDTLEAPELPIDPYEAIGVVKHYYREYKPDLVIASSLGAFYALQFCGAYKILINPALKPVENILSGIGWGRHSVVNEREDGVKEYEINKDFINKLMTLENNFYANILDMEIRHESYALLSSKDELFNNIDTWNTNFYTNHAKLIDSKHRFNKDNVRDYLIPLIKEVCSKWN